MKKSMTVFFACFALLASAQYNFEAGYLIDPSGIRKECLVRYTGWKFNPSFLEYKLSPDAPVLRALVQDVKEFGIGEQVKYIGGKVRIDRSSDAEDDNEISLSMAPEWKVEQLFLKVIEEGDASLYLYEEQGFTRFFFKKGDAEIEQLIFKRYKNSGESGYAVNRNYVNQLYTHVNCRNIPVNQVEAVQYVLEPLRKWFSRHNLCTDPAHRPTGTATRNWLSLKLFAGGSLVAYRSGTSASSAVANISYDPKVSFCAGGELEFILPFNNRRSSLFLEASTLSYKSAGLNSLGDRSTVEYYTINLVLGARQYFLLNRTGTWKGLLDAGAAMDIKQTKVRPALGLGLNYKKYSGEFRYFFQNSLLHRYFDNTNGEKFSHVSFVVKYSLLN